MDNFLWTLFYEYFFKIITTGFASWIIYRLINPLNLVKNVVDVGYNFPNMDRNSKSTQIKMAKRARKLGKLPPVYPNGWFMIAESSEVKNGKAINVSALGENFVLFRSEKGKVFVLDAYCPHIGANMGIGGKVYGDCIECPFHHWRFSGIDGKCTQIPYAAKIPNFAEVKCWKVHEINDLIFVWYHIEGEEPNWYPIGTDEIINKKYWYRGRNQYYVNCHIQELPENGSDISHFNCVHSSALLNGGDLNKQWWTFLKHHWKAEWEPSEDPNNKHLGLGKLETSVELFGKFTLVPMKLEIKQVGPGYVVMKLETTLGPMVIIQTVTPVEPLLQKVVHRFYCPLWASLASTFMYIGECIMVERDIMIWNHKKFISNPILVKEDKAIAKYRRWFNQFYSEHSPTYASTKSLEW